MPKSVLSGVRGAPLGCRGLILGALLLFLALAAYQLDLPGLHYDEAKEAGLNAMQLVTWQPVTAFREATAQVGPWRLPLMVQDYIGALNVLLATPFLALGGVTVPALRWLPLVIAALTLVLTARLALHLGGPAAAAATALLLAVNPSFIFWSRQGIFVTNLTALLFMASLLTALEWWQDRRPRALYLTAFLWGLGVYAKLLFVWAIGAMGIAAAGAWGLDRLRGRRGSRKPEAEDQTGGAPDVQTKKRQEDRDPLRRFPSTSPSALTLILIFVSFLVPLIPLILFNIRTSGTLISIFGNLGRSYYGVDNSAYLPNLLTRLRQVVTLLRGDHFWYLGGVFADPWAPWLATGLVLAAAILLGGRVMRRRTGEAGTWRGGGFMLPVALLALMVAQSAFTVSDLFITHYAMLLPLVSLAGGLAFATVWGYGRIRVGGFGRGGLAVLALIAVLAWAGGDLWTTIRYHKALTVSGGHAAHSDASYALAGYLGEGGQAAPVALDWGIDAPVRFLTAGRVNPIEVFGYERLDAVDAAYAARVGTFLDRPDTLYLAHAAENTVFGGRVEALAALAAERGLTLREAARFAERSGRPLFVIYRAVKAATP